MSAVKILEQLIQKYPREQGAYVALSRIYSGSFFDIDKSVRTLLAGLKSDPMDKNLWNLLAYSHASVGRRVEALDAIDHYVKLAPGEPNPYDTKGDLYVQFGEWDSSLIWYRKAVAIRSDFGSAERLGYDAMDRQEYDHAAEYFLQLRSPTDYAPSIAFHRGQLVKAQKTLRDELSKLQRQGNHDLLGFDYLRLLLADYEMGDYPAMLSDAKERCNHLKNDPSHKGYGRDALAWACLKNGKVKEFRQVLQELEKISNERIPFEHAATSYAQALFEYEQGNFASAVTHYQEGLKTFGGVATQPHLYYAISLLKSGRLAEAIDALQTVSKWYPSGYVDPAAGVPPTDTYAAIATVKAHYWLGAAYELQGNKSQALKAFEKFMEIWKDADFNSKEIDDAKSRISKLRGMSAK
jgi:tetratricopeptide (TPR) repeat protein